ncbi:hypothetical protein KY363_02095 [Candidatus Woesearchaeota archaeon]|nr:hypothetical protein [Candidatus Woesearchaeota archaeon]
MELNSIFTKKRLIFLFIFIALVFIGMRVNFSPIIGAENQFFTLFQFFGPVAGAFLGPVFGAISVLGAQLADFLLVGKEWSWINIIRLTPMLFAAAYFGLKLKGTKRFLGIIVPAACIVLFVTHPVGSQAWIYATWWLIPIAICLLPERYSNKVFLKSLGATFTAHAVGSVAWLFTFNMEPGQWVALMPVVAYERLLFAMGITGSYVLLNTVLDKVLVKLKLRVPSEVLAIDKEHVLSKEWV